MRVFIANFGQENYEWPECHARGTVATMNEAGAQTLWQAGDREGYIRTRMLGKTAAGLTPTRPVASRWFNLMTIISETSDDFWIHREKDELWWTKSTPNPPSFEPRSEPVGRKREVIVCHKPCLAWSNFNRTGNRLSWNGLHAKAHDFLSTEATLQQLSEDYAAYAIALIEGADLFAWHSRKEWQTKQDARGKHGVVISFNPVQRAITRMAMEAERTTEYSNGQRTLRTVKNKYFKFQSVIEAEMYISELIKMQDGVCAITNLPLQYDGDHDDRDMLCSLDRIDSSKHYENGNLQVVCQFVNKWKGTYPDANFRRLLKAVRSAAAI